MKTEATHWADITALKIIREKGDKQLYVCAAGITPSGTVHIGNFREMISVDLVVKALRELGKQVRFIFSWDDYDVFRKIPANMPQKEMLETHLRKPITVVPDPHGSKESYARYNEYEIEKLLPLLGIEPEFIYQAEQYAKGCYTELMRQALINKDTIKAILNEHRTSELPPDWWPISIFCTSCQKDTTKISNWDGEYAVSYSCSACGNNETLDLKRAQTVKLFWRVDFPMRWSYEKVDFEPGGKEHHSAGGSFDTASSIVKQVYNHEPPVTFKYDFIRIKGKGGKISSSTGDVISLQDVMYIYQPEIIRYLFAGTRPNAEFAISFDLDVLKIYEDYDKCERIYFGREDVSEKRKQKEKRIYELSQVREIPAALPEQIPFRHLCNLLQIYEGQIPATLKALDAEDDTRLQSRARCAWNWITTYAPPEFRFHLRNAEAVPVSVTENQGRAVTALYRELDEKFSSHDERSLAESIYNLAHEHGLEPKEFFKTLYRILINKEMGPRLAGFILTIGRDKIMSLLTPYVS
ncbi:MAG: lysine--tRNA ligase [Spirochaetales bacterium]|nr:lysine--tRNA ligase [Spirochaetales bacterium]